jgi:hypothetical protein
MLVRAIAILAHTSFGFAFNACHTVDLATFFVASHAGFTSCLATTAI